MNVARLVTAYYYTEAADPSLPEHGTENIYKLYTESFSGVDGIRRMPEEAQTIVADALMPMPERGEGRAASVLSQETVHEAKEEWRNEGNSH